MMKLIIDKTHEVLARVKEIFTIPLLKRVEIVPMPLTELVLARDSPGT
jgi:hypothetical protein